MDIEVLKEFITLADKLNFSETAKTHFITQPVLTKHIQQLEETLGVTLFHRSRQAVELTKLGEAFLEDAQLIVATYESALKKMAIAAEKFESSFSLAFLDAAAKHFLPTVISTIITDHPSVSLELKNANIPQTYRLLESRECDMAITLKPMAATYPEYDYIHLYRDPLCVILPDNHPLASRESLTFNDIKDERLITASPDLISDYRLFIERLLKKNEIVINMKRDTDSVEEGFLLVESGYGISIVPSHQHHFATPHVKFVPLSEEECYADVVLTWRKDNPNPNIPKVLKIIEQLSISI